MLPQVLPILQPTINWTDLVKSAEAALGYNPSKVEAKRPLSEPARFLALVAHLKDKSNVDAVASLREATSVLETLHYGFLVACDKDVLFELMQCTKLSISTNAAINGDTVSIVTGSLAVWRDSIIELSQDNTYCMRLLLDKVFICFERLGLGELWADYKKHTLKDQTIILLEK